MGTNHLVKRFLDITVAGIGLAVLAPVYAIVAIAIRCTIGKPILFRQLRPGQDERLFVLLKFRTMRATFDQGGRLLPDRDRLTKLGLWLRKLSLDELPQLVTVLRGDMSLVGPRPLLSEYLPRYSARQRRRHELKPGLTGWAQVNGRNAITWEQKFDLDMWYVEHRTFWLDMRILWLTILKVLQRAGIHQEGHATMPEFQGSKGQGQSQWNQ